MPQGRSQRRFRSGPPLRWVRPPFTGSCALGEPGERDEGSVSAPEPTQLITLDNTMLARKTADACFMCDDMSRSWLLTIDRGERRAFRIITCIILIEVRPVYPL